MFGLGIAQHNAQAEIHACDWAPVLTAAQENAERLGVAARFHKRPGSVYEIDFGTGYDLILLLVILSI